MFVKRGGGQWELYDASADHHELLGRFEVRARNEVKQPHLPEMGDNRDQCICYI